MTASEPDLWMGTKWTTEWTTTPTRQTEEVLLILYYGLSNTLHDPVDHVLPHGVVATRVVVCRVLFPRDELLRVEKFFVLPNSDLICNKQINHSKARKSVTHLDPFTLLKIKGTDWE